MSESLPLFIQSAARRNKLFLVLLGLCFFAISFSVASWWPSYQLHVVLGYLVGILLILIGLLKYFEPVDSLCLTDQQLTYLHRYGQWSIDWSDIVLVMQPSFHYGLERRDIPYLGIKLRDISGVIDSVSPRLASRQIHEQRDILVLACQQKLITVEQATLNFAKFKYDDRIIDGPKAAWLHQMVVLRQAYGCDLYIPINSFVQQPAQLIALFKQYQQRVNRDL